MAEIGFVGAGNMAEAIIGGVLKKGMLGPGDVVIHEIRAERAEEMHGRYGIETVPSVKELARRCSEVVLAVKPDAVDPILEQAGGVLSGKLVISIAAGTPISALQAHLGSDSRVVRVMPNTPALVLEGAAALCASPSCSAADIGRAVELFSCVGRCIQVQEKLMDAVTALSGSGPAFCFLFVEALADGGVRAGLPRALALELAAATVKGSAEMVLQTGRHPGDLKDMVASPGGTTIEGLSVLESKSFRSAVMDAVFAAFRKAASLVS